MQLLPKPQEKRETWLVTWILVYISPTYCMLPSRIKLSDCYAVGQLYNTKLGEDVRRLIDEKYGSGSAPTMASQFLRACVNKTLYYSKSYTRMKTRNSYTVCYKDDDNCEQYALVNYFLSLQTMSVAVVTPLSLTTEFCFPHQLCELRQYHTCEENVVFSCHPS